MDIIQTNRVIDKFMKRMFDVDVYLTPLRNPYPGKEYGINILFFPSKFFPQSPDYSEKYHRFFNRNEMEVKSDLFKPFKYLGINTEKIDTDMVRIIMPDKMDDFLLDYTTELVNNINDFFETQKIDGADLSNEISNVRISGIDLGIEERIYLVLRLKYDSNLYTNVSDYLNTYHIRGFIVDYLGTKMELVPQIGFWFEEQL